VEVRRFGDTVSVTDHGVVRVQVGAEEQEFDLYDHATGVAMHGRPGEQTWRVELSRADAPAVTIEPGDVEAEAFTRELIRWRPEVRL
jgi:hypothetical protein